MSDVEVGPPRFVAGQRVRISVGHPRTHCRTPFYLRGAPGSIERHCGSFPNPELVAHGVSGPPVHLYRVRARQVDVWPHYAGSPGDTIEVEVYEHWIERDDEQ